MTANQIRDFKSRQPKFFDDGQPQMQVLVTINTGVTDPMVEDDDGRRTVYIKGFGLQRHAWLQALHNAGLRKAAEVRPGDRFTATFTGFGEAKPGMNAPKLFEYVIEHQSPADLAMNQPQQPGMQQAQPAAAVRAPAAHAGPESGICAGSGRPMEPADAAAAAATRPAGTARPATAAG